MAQGDVYTQCGNALTTEQLIRKCIYRDADGNPVLHTDPTGTALQPYFDCDTKEINLDQVFRLMVLEDADGNPYLNTTSS